MMSTTVMKQSTMVRPAEEIPRRTLRLSSLDMVIRTPLSHTPSVHIYPSPHEKEGNHSSSCSNFFDTTVLKESLAKVLVPFYPMAGRLKLNDETGRVDQIDCNGEGVLFIEAEIMTHSLAEFGGFAPTPELRKLVTPSWDYSRGISSIPLMMVQLTRFRCGGVTLGFGTHHHIGDGYTFTNLIRSWARLARGLDLDFMPCHERFPYLSPRNPPEVKFQHVEYNPPQGLLSGVSLEGETTTHSLFKLTKDQMEALKQQAISSKAVNHKLSTYEVLAGHVWRTACRARGLVDEQEVRLFVPIDGRYRLKKPALPQGFCGNVVFFPTCVAKSGDITRNPLFYAASTLHETLERVKDEEYLRSTIDFLDTHPNFDSLVRGQHTARCPNLTINSWTNLPFYESDFGWGRPSFAGRSGLDNEGQCYIVRSTDGDGGFCVLICLFSRHMSLFEKYLYDF